ncbi:hypothetical protein GLOTRDRAFT_95743 [Gloeophyllum trabeum ATCC 11539]|uniref:Uncharacterized protein n=1 Tax=Gloeophyllum trabeum (strain ATCC 11539 / FP-39264 / Madison 617) TaxID=670483 RepID=S7RHJ4_GLOTA|nr:uncharacterized protein GLOTRDRAFT_95743 [Gloeophyllum trabeum ATCC 11539]EPQ52064.1 hypothetical protein GLOTRDRAFT_95743 [Gloeophyllum trabeum ATCC 11539]
MPLGPVVRETIVGGRGGWRRRPSAGCMPRERSVRGCQRRLALLRLVLASLPGSDADWAHPATDPGAAKLIGGGPRSAGCAREGRPCCEIRQPDLARLRAKAKAKAGDGMCTYWPMAFSRRRVGLGPGDLLLPPTRSMT